MTREEAIKTIEKIGKNEELVKKISEISSVEEAVKLLKANGFDIKPEDIENVASILECGNAELKDEQLDMVAGGFCPYNPQTVWWQNFWNKKK